MLRVWNVSLIVATFTLALLGTFLVRSGILESIHAFGDSTVGGPLLALIAVVVIGSAALIVSRLDDLRSERRIESLFSRESVFLVNNLLLVGLCVVIFWGTFFPLISEAITGEKSSLGPPWFDRFVAPLAIVLVLFTGNRPAARLAPGQPGVAVAARPRAAGGRRASSLSRSPRSRDALEAPLALVAVRVRVLRARRARDRVLARGRRPAGARRRQPGPPRWAASWPATAAATAATSSTPGSRSCSSPSPRRRASRRARTCACSPASRRKVGDYDGHLRASRRSSIDPKEQRLNFGAVLDVSRDGKQVATLYPSRNYYSIDDRRRARSPASSRARRRARSGRRTSVGGDIWTAMRPDLTPLDDGDRARSTSGLQRSLPGHRARRTDARPARGDARLHGPPGPGDPQPRGALRRQSAAGRLPRQRQPARDLDLDRRRDRGRRRR